MLPSTASDRKGAKIEHDISWFYQKDFFSEHQNNAEFKNLDDSEVLSSNFPGLKTSAASMTSTASFHQKNYSSWGLDHPYHQNDQYQPVPFWGMDHQKPNFSLIPFLSEAVLKIQQRKWGPKFRVEILQS